MIHIQQNLYEICFKDDQKTVLSIPRLPGCPDEFTLLEEGIWAWQRRCPVATTHMTLSVQVCGLPDFWVIPAVNYNGNGFGPKGDQYSRWQAEAEYQGLTCGDQPWVYAQHRCAVPGATCSEGNGYVCALFSEPNDANSCALEPGPDCLTHRLIWPQAEGPRVFTNRGRWSDAYQLPGLPKDRFNAFIMLAPLDQPKTGYRHLLDFAWRKFAHIPPLQRPRQEIWDLSIRFAKTLWQTTEDGFSGFNIGLSLDQASHSWQRTRQRRFEIGWCGQNASLANSLLWEFLLQGDQEALEKGLAVLDSWARYAPLPDGVFRTHMDQAQGGTKQDQVADACNLGTAARQFFIAAELAARCGQHRPQYLKTALAICDFAVRVQSPDGRLAKSWTLDGQVAQPAGTVGAFLLPPLLTAYRQTGQAHYREAALAGYQYYRRELLEQGCTTAGALDTFCVDKESAMPLLKTALSLYADTGEAVYLQDALRAAWYLSTWQWHYNTAFPPDSELAHLGFKTCGSTAVSTGHQHLDAYALYYYRDLQRLADFTGDNQWRERAQGIFNNASQLISDGHLVVLRQSRPAGSQDEAFFQTNWGQPYAMSQWLVAWPCALRLEALWPSLTAGTQAPNMPTSQP